MSDLDIDYLLANSKSQRECWYFIDDYKRSHNGNPPPRSEIAAHLNCTTQNVDILLLKLAKKGLIVLDEHEKPMLPGREYPPPPIR